MNARGNTVAARLEDILNCVREVAGHGVRRGTAVALAIAQLESGHDFEELTDDMEMAAAAISEDVSIEAVIGNVFADD